MSKGMRSVQSVQIASELDRDYEAVLNFRHDLQALCGDLTDLPLIDMCEADDISGTVAENGNEDKDERPRKRGLTKRDAEASKQTNHQS